MRVSQKHLDDPFFTFGLPIVRKVGDPKDEKTLAWNLRDVAVEALMTFDPRHATGIEKYESFRIARLVHDSGENGVSLKPEEAARIKEAIGFVFPPAIVGPAYDIIDGSPAE